MAGVLNILSTCGFVSSAVVLNKYQICQLLIKFNWVGTKKDKDSHWKQQTCRIKNVCINVIDVICNLDK